MSNSPVLGSQKDLYIYAIDPQGLLRDLEIEGNYSLPSEIVESGEIRASYVGDSIFSSKKEISLITCVTGFITSPTRTPVGNLDKHLCDQ